MAKRSSRDYWERQAEELRQADEDRRAAELRREAAKSSESHRRATGARYADWMRRIGFENATPYQLDEAKRLLGFVALRAESLGPLHSLRLRRVLSDGSAITASIMGGQRTIQLEPVTVPQVEELTETSRIWIPRGFVVYPSTTSHPHGWGQPALTLSGTDPWSRASLAPGTDPTKWTDGGPLGEVLITRDKNAGYPSLTKPVSPLFFEKTEVRTSLPAGHWIAPRTGEWTGYRSEYVDYTQAPAFGRELLTYTNTQRGEPLTPWFRGYFEEAVYLSEKVPATVFDGANPTLPPGVVLDGYSTAAKRLNKDGGIEVDSADAVTSNQTTVANVANVFDSSINLFSNTFNSSSSLGIGIQGNVVVGEVAHRKQWIRYGDATWVSGVQEHPILSWDGGGDFKLPFYMITLPFAADGFGHLQPYGGTTVGPYPDYAILDDLSTITASVRGRQKPLFSKEVFCRGRVLGRFEGYVFGAAIQVVTQDAQHVQDRLLVLTWHADDQDVYVPPGGGSVLDPPEAHILRKLRLYFVDIAPRNGLRVNPDHMLTQSDMKFAGYLPMTDFPEDRAYPTKFPRQMPRFSHDGKKLIQVIGEYLVSGGLSEIFTHDLAEYALTNIDDGVLGYTRTVIAHGMGGPDPFQPDESFEVADYDNNNQYTSLISYIAAWPYADLFPGGGAGTIDLRVLSRPDHSGQMPYMTEMGEPVDPQCVPAYYGSLSVYDVNHYAAASVYLTGTCTTLDAWSSRLIVMHEGVRIYDAVSPQDSSNRIYGGAGSGHWYDGSYARIGDDIVFSVEVGAFANETYIITDALTFVLATEDSRVTGFISSTLPDIVTLVGGQADCLVPAGVV